MTKKMGLMALGLSMVLLSGCGSDDNNNTPSTPPAPNLNTPAEVMKNIVGIWSTACIDFKDGFGSEIDGNTFNADGTGAYSGAEFDAPGCNAEDVVDAWAGTFTYTMGEATTGAAGEEAVELDIVLAEGEGDYYTMVLFDSADSYLMADERDGDADIPESRANIFEGEEESVYIRQ